MLSQKASVMLTNNIRQSNLIKNIEFIIAIIGTNGYKNVEGPIGQ